MARQLVNRARVRPPAAADEDLELVVERRLGLGAAAVGQGRATYSRAWAR